MKKSWAVSLGRKSFLFMARNFNYDIFLAVIVLIADNVMRIYSFFQGVCWNISLEKGSFFVFRRFATDQSPLGVERVGENEEPVRS